MNRISNLIDNTRSRIYYRQAVYVPGYEYSPWKKWLIISAIALLALLIVAGIIGQHTPNGVSEGEVGLNSVSAHTPAEKKDEQQASGDTKYYQVTRVIDGDTIDVTVDGKVEKVRLIGVDTPETQDPRKSIQCFGKEASAFTSSILTGASIRLESDSTQGDRDKYGRLLRYIFLVDGTNFNEKVIRDGYAHEYTYEIPYRYQTQFKAALSEARDAGRGLWAASTCNGDTSQAADKPQTTPTPVAVSAPSDTAYYSNCDAARAAGAAPIYQGQPGYRSKLDRDSDGIACET